MNNSRRCLLAVLVLTLAVLMLHGAMVIWIDPFFHYHAPLKDFYYKRPEQVERYMNDGIVRNFDYDALITGFSTSSLFSLTEFDELFGTHAEKIIYSGGTYKETGEGMRRALMTHPGTKVVLCNLFLTKLSQDKDHRRSDITDYPTYLYNDFLPDDIKYLLNKEVVFNYCYPMIRDRLHGEMGGVESFDSEGFHHKKKDEIVRFEDLAARKMQRSGKIVSQLPLSDEEQKNVRENMEQNLISIAEKYPDTRFIYFVPPCSILFYQNLYENGELLKTLQAQEIALNMLLETKNIELYSFTDSSIIEDLHNYTDSVHYGGWVYSYMLECISEGRGQITAANIKEYCDGQMDYFMNYQY